jgi:peroxiredoxin
MTISVGEKVPQGSFRAKINGEGREISSAELFDGKMVVLFAVPGAFTPTCSNNHLPGFIDNIDAIRSRGVDTIAVIAANDHHVMSAWAKASGGEGKILFLADGNADYARKLGLDMDMSAAGMGTRYKRFSMLVKDGAVETLNIEEAPGRADVSGAACILEQLGA